MWQFQMMAPSIPTDSAWSYMSINLQKCSVQVKKKAKNGLQIAQSLTREAKLVILSYRALKKKTENQRKKMTKADTAEKQKKCEKSKQRISLKNFQKKNICISC